MNRTCSIWPLLLGLCFPASHAQVPLYAVESPTPKDDALFGDPVVGVPDLDGDGRGDVAVGARLEDGDGIYEAGHVHVYSGATGSLLYSLVSPNPELMGYFGLAVAGVDDLDGDGRGELLVGAGREDDGGRAYIFSGATGALLRTLTSPNPVTVGSFGGAVATLPDVDGDGFSDLLIGAYGEEVNGMVRSGRAYLFSGATGTLLHTLASPDPSGYGLFGTAVLGVPDADGDGRYDLLVGAPFENDGAPTGGQAHLFSSAGGQLLGTLASPAHEGNGHFGSAFGLVPDGDGGFDLLVGAPAEDGGVKDAGRAYLFAEYDPTAAEPGPGEEAFRLRVTPNPARDDATLTLTLPAPSAVRLAVYDLLGREVVRLADGLMPAGTHHVRLDGAALPAGVYLVRLLADDDTRFVRMTRLR